jgi:glutamate decarboxylase
MEQNRCVNMIAHLFNAPIGDDETAVGVGTVGSSEAIMLAGLAFKRKWQNKMKAAGKPCDKPNIVTGANVQVHCLHRLSAMHQCMSCWPCQTKPNE